MVIHGSMICTNTIAVRARNNFVNLKLGDVKMPNTREKNKGTVTALNVAMSAMNAKVINSRLFLRKNSCCNTVLVVRILLLLPLEKLAVVTVDPSSTTDFPSLNSDPSNELLRKCPRVRLLLLLDTGNL